MEAIINNGAMAMDGGSILLNGVDAEGAPLSVHLDWSIKAHREGTRSLTVNGQVIPIGSPEEVHWLQVLAGARIEHQAGERELGGIKISPNSVAVGADISNYLSKIDDGPNEALAALVTQLMAHVTSDGYQHQKPPPPPPPPLEDQLLELILDGKDLDALKLYRRAHPDVSLSDAKAAVEKLKNS